MVMRKLIAPLVMLIGAFIMSMTVAQAQAPQAAAPVAASSDQEQVSLTDGYVLGTGDVVEVSVLGREEFRPRVQVQTDGTIQLPFLGSVDANGLTVLQLRQKVSNALKKGGYYADPVVNVAIASYASRYIVVLGEVATPGIVPIDRSYRVSEIIARVGGIKLNGADSITLTRTSGEQFMLSMQEMATGGPDQDPVVNPGDKLYVPAAETFYIYGQVSAPGTYPVDKQMNLRKALARGGGLTSMGSEKRVKVFRDGEEIRKFNPSSPIKGGDVIVVGERFF